MQTLLSLLHKLALYPQYLLMNVHKNHLHVTKMNQIYRNQGFLVENTGMRFTCWMMSIIVQWLFNVIHYLLGTNILIFQLLLPRSISFINIIININILYMFAIPRSSEQKMKLQNVLVIKKKKEMKTRKKGNMIHTCKQENLENAMQSL